jgi:hypothetical protein
MVIENTFLMAALSAAPRTTVQERGNRTKGNGTVTVKRVKHTLFRDGHAAMTVFDAVCAWLLTLFALRVRSLLARSRRSSSPRHGRLHKQTISFEIKEKNILIIHVG